MVCNVFITFQLAHTIEQFGEAMVPEREEPTASVLEHFDQKEEKHAAEEDATSPKKKVSSIL